jgi:hypothetical protein
MNKKLKVVPRKLTLNREALRRLDLTDAQLRGVVGGLPLTNDCGHSDECGDKQSARTSCCSPSPGTLQGGGVATGGGTAK